MKHTHCQLLGGNGERRTGVKTAVLNCEWFMGNCDGTAVSLPIWCWQVVQLGDNAGHNDYGKIAPEQRYIII